MTLFRVLLMGLILLISTIGITTAAIYLRASQQFLMQQLALHGQDSVTSLGLSLQPVLAQGDWVLAQSIIDGSFDQGDYRLLKLTSIDKQHQLERKRAQTPQPLPIWFERLLPLQAPVMSTQINGRWKLVATLELQVSDEASKRLLWQISQQAAMALVLIGLVATVIGSWLLKRLLRPLKLAQQQANGLRKHQYLRQKHIPAIKETADLVHTMNLMVDNSESMFKHQSARIERLRQQTTLDPDTGLSNQGRYQQRLAQALKDREHQHGVVVRVHLAGLSKVEAKQGLAAEQQLFTATTEELQHLGLQLPEGRVYRIGFAEFALLFPSCSSDDVALLEQPYRQKLLALLNQLGGERVIFAACDYYVGQSLAQFEQQLEQALMEALSGAEQSVFYRHQQDSPSAIMPSLDLLFGTPPKLLIQDVTAANGSLLHQELLARFSDDEREYMPTQLMAMVVRQQRYKQFDLVVLNTALAHLDKLPEQTVLSWNLTAESMLDPEFRQQLLRRLKGRWQRLLIEIPQRALLLDENGTRHFITQMAAAGAQLWLDHTTPAGIGLMAQPGLAGIKLDPSYSQEFAANDDLLELMVATAHSRGIKVVAQQVESPSMVKRLYQLGFDGVQGYGVARPTPIKD